MASQKQGFIWISGFLFLSTLVLSTADVHYYDFFLQESQFTKLCSTKNILTVNGSFPGPEIRVRRGDTVFVNVHNQANTALSIKWEGVEESINGSNDMIQPGRNFTYHIELHNEIGTLWWHATSAWASTTVHGAFVVLPAPNEGYPFLTPDSDQTIILGEWFKQELTEANQNIASGQADAYTINGHPGETYGCSSDTTFDYQVNYGALYLVRVINAVNDTMVFRIAYHSLTVVGQNGAYSRRSFRSSLTLAPGQVTDVLLCPYQNLGHYYITARPSSDATHTAVGILRYATTINLSSA
ncbi:laccase-12-like [Hibiscus syriacus]|uniref:laccase-12-like n=1 Tax=Hibiscus syriacus TaxID=106335 RepID=UPI0019240485|nr:laccase-12-like [Hibiscus syriacus]